MQEYKNISTIEKEIKKYFELKDDYWRGTVKLIELSWQAVVIKKLIFAEKNVRTSHFWINKFKFGQFHKITNSDRIKKEETDYYFLFGEDARIQDYLRAQWFDQILAHNNDNFAKYNKQHHLKNDVLATEVEKIQKITAEIIKTEAF